jgi:hypothetical protein
MDVVRAGNRPAKERFVVFRKANGRVRVVKDLAVRWWSKRMASGWRVTFSPDEPGGPLHSLSPKRKAAFGHIQTGPLGFVDILYIMSDGLSRPKVSHLRKNAMKDGAQRPDGRNRTTNTTETRIHRGTEAMLRKP